MCAASKTNDWASFFIGHQWLLRHLEIGCCESLFAIVILDLDDRNDVYSHEKKTLVEKKLQWLNKTMIKRLNMERNTPNAYEIEFKKIKKKPYTVRTTIEM